MDLLRRIRWGNVARAAALVVAVVLVLAWPRLRSEPPALPPEPALAAPASVTEESREFGVEPPPESRSGAEWQPQRRAKPRARRRSKTRPTRRRRRRVKARVVVPAPVKSPEVVAPVWRAPAPRSEFGFGE